MPASPFKRRRLEDEDYIEAMYDYPSDESSTKHSIAQVRETSKADAPAIQSPRMSHHSAKDPAISGHGPTVFRLQTNELVSRMRPNYEMRMAKVENALRKLKSVIESIPSRDALPVIDAQRELELSSRIQVPFPEPQPGAESRYTLAYSKPTRINVVGSYARRTAVVVQNKLTVDLAVTMPSHLFQPKDYREYRYFYKRAYYLAVLAAGIDKNDTCSFKLSFAYQDDNQLQPVIAVEPIAGSGEDDFTKSRCSIRIILAAITNLFPWEKLLPTKAAIRHNIQGTEACRERLLSFYNATIQSECSSAAYFEILHQSTAQSDGFVNACILGSLWLRQRGFGSSITSGGFGQFEWASIMSMLMRVGGQTGKPLLSNGYTSDQLFKAMLQFFSVRNLLLSPFSTQASNMQLNPAFGPVFYDSSRNLNLLFKMTPWSYQMLKNEAIMSLKSLSDPLSDSFKSLFIIRAFEPLRRFDYIFSVPLGYSDDIEASRNNVLGHTDLAYKLYQSLEYGLTDRVTSINIECPCIDSWTLASARPSAPGAEMVMIGLSLNPNQSYRKVDRGPPAEDKEMAATFRKFWGQKAELRRFKDGAILESLIWSNSNTGQDIIERVIDFIIRRHFGEKIAQGTQYLQRDITRYLPQDEPANQGLLGHFQTAESHFGALSEKIRVMEDLPLRIRQISAACSELRDASIFTDFLNGDRTLQGPMDIHVQFEGSTRWPNELTAVQMVKIALLLKIAEILETSDTGISARLGIENDHQTLQNRGFLDISQSHKALFRLRVHYEREIRLLECSLDNPIYKSRSKEDRATAVSEFKRKFIRCPAHTSGLKLLSTRLMLLSPTIKLLKKWRDSHLLSTHIKDEFIELLALRTFVHPYPWQIPGSTATAFLRTLAYISTWQWQSDPLIVDFNSELSDQDIAAIKLRFDAWRKIDPGMNRMTMFAASNLDRDGITWTEHHPSKVIAVRFQRLAQAACQLVQDQSANVNLDVLFVPSLAEYDFIIYLKSEGVVEGSHNGRFKNLKLSFDSDARAKVYNPALEFLNELEALYTGHVIFFYHQCKPAIIAGLWNPQTGPRQWRINLAYSTLPSCKDNQGECWLTMNKSSILHAIARLGGDMVTKIEERR